MRNFAILLSAAAVIAACSEPPAPVEESVRTVMVDRAGALSAARNLSYTGTLRAANRAELGFEASGILTSLTVDLGESFKRGDVLGTVDATAARLDLEARQAERVDAQSILSEATLDYERRESLRGTGAISNSNIDQAKARMESAAARLAAIEAQIGSAHQRISNTRLIAPFDGGVAARLIEPSQVVAVGQPVLSVIGQDAGLEAVVNIPERLRSAVSLGQTVQITARSSERAISAAVLEIGSRSNAAGLFPVTFVIDENQTDGLSAGQAIEVRLSAPNAPSAGLTIPLASYTLSATGEPVVFVINDAGDAVRQVPIELGRANNRGVEVVSGLSAHDLIVVRGADLLRDGQPVNPAGQSVARYND